MIITVTMDDYDFEALFDSAANWNEFVDIHRSYEDIEDHKKPLNLDFKSILWLGKEYTNVILAKSYLRAQGMEFQVIVDNNYDFESGYPTYAILCNHELGLSDSETLPE